VHFGPIRIILTNGRIFGFLPSIFAEPQAELPTNFGFPSLVECFLFGHLKKDRFIDHLSGLSGLRVIFAKTRFQVPSEYILIVNH
jgi:hypothetical protein